MKYVYLGATGLKVGELCLGAMTFGRESSKKDSYQMLDRFADAGGNFIDTANVYSNGKSESILGRWLKERNRDDFVIATLEPFVTLQPLYNLLDRSTEWELLPVCQNEGLGVIPWSPLRGGWLTGKYKRGMEAPPEGTRIESAEREGWSESWSAYNNERTWTVIDELVAVAEELGKEPAQVALRWLIQRPGITAPIIGARTLDQLEGNLGAADWSLVDEHMRRLTTSGDTGKPYPYDFIDQASGER